MIVTNIDIYFVRYLNLKVYSLTGQLILVHTHMQASVVSATVCERLCAYKKVLWKVEVYVCVYAWLHVRVNECVIVLVALGEAIKGRSRLSVTGLNLWPRSKLDMSYFPPPNPCEFQHVVAGSISEMQYIYTVKRQPVLSCC